MKNIFYRPQKTQLLREEKDAKQKSRPAQKEFIPAVDSGRNANKQLQEVLEDSSKTLLDAASPEIPNKVGQKEEAKLKSRPAQKEFIPAVDSGRDASKNHQLQEVLEDLSETLLEAVSSEIPNKIGQTKKSKIAPWAEANFFPSNLPSSDDTDEALEAQTKARDSKKTDCVIDVIDPDPKQTLSTRERRSFEQVSNGDPKVKTSNDEV